MKGVVEGARGETEIAVDNFTESGGESDGMYLHLTWRSGRNNATKRRNLREKGGRSTGRLGSIKKESKPRRAEGNQNGPKNTNPKMGSRAILYGIRGNPTRLTSDNEPQGGAKK